MIKPFAFLFVALFLPLFALAQSQDFSEGDAVVTTENLSNVTKHFSGMVKQVFPDNTVEVLLVDGTYSGQTYVYRVDQLSKPLSCSKNICVNDAVITTENFSSGTKYFNGLVKKVFPDGTMEVLLVDGTYAGQTYVYDASKLFLKKK